VFGGLAFLGRLDRRRAGYALVAFSAVGVIAYGGLGIGTAAGVVAGAFVLRARGSRAGAPSEWSGSLPVGVPPVLGGPKRPLTDRPPVTEWDGVLAAAPAGPPGKGRGRVSLPPADRLSAALEKGRTASLLLAGPASSPHPAAVVVLPPPPTGLRVVRPAPAAAAPALRPAPGPGPATLAGAGPGPGRAPPAETTRPGSTWAPHMDRWQPTAKEVSPWVITVDAGSASQGRPAPPASAAAPPGLSPPEPAAPPPPLPREPLVAPLAPPPVTGLPPSPVPAPEGRTRIRPPLRAPQLRATPPPSRPVPVTEAPPATPVPASVAPPPTLFAPSTAATPPAVPAPPPFTPTVLSGPRSTPMPSAISPDGLPTATAPPTALRTPAPIPPVPLAPPETAPAAADRPAPPTKPIAKTRIRAWNCPKCNLINAPWSLRCTRCKSEPPAIGS